MSSSCRFDHNAIWTVLRAFRCFMIKRLLKSKHGTIIIEKHQSKKIERLQLDLKIRENILEANESRE